MGLGCHLLLGSSDRRLRRCAATELVVQFLFFFLQNFSEVYATISTNFKGLYLQRILLLYILIVVTVFDLTFILRLFIYNMKTKSCPQKERFFKLMFANGDCDECVVAGQNVFLGPTIHLPRHECFVESHHFHLSFLICCCFQVRFHRKH